MSIESSRDNGPEQSTPDKAKALLGRLEKGEAVQLYNAMSKLGDDPSFVGRINFIKRNPSFIDGFNKNKPANMAALSTTKDAYGYKGTAEQNAIFFKTYLELKAAGLDKKGEVKETQPAETETDPHMPGTDPADLDAYLAFLPKPEDLNTGEVYFGGAHPNQSTPKSPGFFRTGGRRDVIQNVRNEFGTNTQVEYTSERSAPDAKTVSQELPTSDAPRGAVDLASVAPNERAATVAKELAREAGDLNYLLEAYPMALSAASTTILEGLGSNPYDKLAQTKSARLENGAVILTQADGTHLTTSLFTDDAFHPKDIRGTAEEIAAKEEATANGLIASANRPKDELNPDLFNDDEEFLFDDSKKAS
ncbi:MAG: hypothetical protein WC777_02315 [Candidatus Gracilibacteria bacterium]|jgi:hypothetical protein